MLYKISFNANRKLRNGWWIAVFLAGLVALPVGIHFSANVVQGPVLGFGVSDSTGPGLQVAKLGERPAWLSGGTFELEASLPGMICVVLMTRAIWLAPQRVRA